MLEAERRGDADVKTLLEQEVRSRCCSAFVRLQTLILSAQRQPLATAFGYSKCKDRRLPASATLSLQVVLSSWEGTRPCTPSLCGCTLRLQQVHRGRVPASACSTIAGGAAAGGCGEAGPAVPGAARLAGFGGDNRRPRARGGAGGRPQARIPGAGHGLQGVKPGRRNLATGHSTGGIHAQGAVLHVLFRTFANG